MKMENSNSRKKLEQKLNFYKTLIADYEKTQQELNTSYLNLGEDGTNRTKSSNHSQKFQTQKTLTYSNVPNFKSKYSLDKTKRILPASNNLVQNGRTVQYKNCYTSFKSKINYSNNSVYNVQRNKFVKNNCESNIRFKSDHLASKYSIGTTGPFTKVSNSPIGTTRKVDLVGKKSDAKVFTPKAVSTFKINQNSDNTDCTQNMKVTNSCSKNPTNSYSQVLNEIISVTKKLKQSVKDCHSSPKVQCAFVAKTVSPVEKRLSLGDKKNSVLNPSNNLKVLRADKFSTAIKLSESSSTSLLKPTPRNEIKHSQINNVINKVDTRSSTSVFQLPNLHLQSSSISLSQSSKDPMKTRINSNRKIISTKYKVVNKNTPPQVKYSASKLEKIKPVDCKSVCLQKIHKSKLNSPKVKNVLKSKYKIINKTVRNSTLNSPVLQSGFSKRNVYKLVNLPNTQTSPFNLGVQISKSRSAFNKTPKGKLLKGLNVTPTFKVYNLKGKTNVHVSNYKNSIKKPHILNSKYKVINKFSMPKRNIIVNKSLFQLNSQKKLIIPSTATERILPVQPTSIQKPVLLKRLYKSKNKIINKNSSPVSVTAKMIKTKYVALNKHRSLPIAKQFLSSRPILFNRYQTRRSYYSKPRHIKGRHYPTFYNPRLVRFPSMNRFSKTNIKVKSNFFQRRKFMTAGFAYGNKFTSGYHKSVFRNSKITAPVSQILASRVLHRSINQVVTKHTKKNLMKVNTYCMFYNRFGKCNKGMKCSFIHDPSKIAVCTRFLRGTCKSKNCPFSHEVCPGKMALCTYYLLGSCNNDKCPYRHESLSPNSELCKEFVQGYCNKGRKCEKAHILICPHYVKGSCDKGAACLFPHPPQKAKKSTAQDVKEISPAKESEELFLENVSRYFQAFAEGSVLGMPSEPPENCHRVVVRRSRLLPEQPSFIPLSQTEPQDNT